MKIILVAVLIGIFSFSAIAQTPNSNFETWNNMGNYEDPAQWGTLNSMTNAASIYTCQKGTPGNPGASYLMLRSKNVSGFGIVPGMAVTGIIDSVTYLVREGFAFTQRPQTLSSNLQFMSYSGSDFGFIAIYLTKWNTTTSTRDTISKTVTTLTGMAMSWTPFNIMLSYQMGSFPDSAQIILSASGTILPQDGDYLYVDNLSFAGSVAGIEDNENISNPISVFPNPSSGFFTVTTTDASKGNIEVYSPLGQLVYTTEIQIDNREIDLSNQSNGVYFVRVSSSSGIMFSKIIIVK